MTRDRYGAFLCYSYLGCEKQIETNFCGYSTIGKKQNYAAALIAKGIPKERMKKYGFAFCGKKVLIGE